MASIVGANRTFTSTPFYAVVQGAVVLLTVTIWFPGAMRIAGTDGSASFLLALLVAVLCVPLYAQIGRRLHRSEAAWANAILASAGLIMLLSLVSMLYADNPVRTLRTIFAHLFGFAFIPAIVAISVRPNGPDALKTIHFVFIVMSVLTSCLVIMGFGEAKFADRAGGYFKHSNQLGIALSAALPLLVARLVASRKYRVTLLGCIVVVLVGLIETGSKTNIVVSLGGATAFFVLYGLYLARRRQGPLLIIMGVIAAPLMIQASLWTLQFLNPRAYRLLALQFSGGDAHSVVARERLWSMSLELGLSHPFTGVGAGQPLGEVAPHSHNLFIEYFRTLGVPGAGLITLLVLLVLAYLAFAVFQTLRGSGRSRQTVGVDVMVLGASVSVINYVAANQMSDSFGPSTAPFFWLPLALLIALRGMQRTFERVGARVSVQLGLPSHR